MGRTRSVKRFWKQAEAVREDDGWGVALDGRPLRTPARAEIKVPGEALAKAIADEWNSVKAEVDPRFMPLTGLANAAIDRVAPEKAAFAAGLARYAEADLACYRAEGPRALVERQATFWAPLLDWARRHFDVDFKTTSRLVHVAQPPATVDRLGHAVAALDAFRLAGLSPLVTIGGSLVAGLGVLEKAFTPAEAWDAVSVDERWQLDQWGSDSEAEQALDNRKRDFLAAARFLELLDQS
jgi:chaperone required for assembly of F1-ATPase